MGERIVRLCIRFLVEFHRHLGQKAAQTFPSYSESQDLEILSKDCRTSQPTYVISSLTFIRAYMSYFALNVDMSFW